MNLISPVILCGGSGTRLSPLTNKKNPKQFIRIHGSSLFSQTLARIQRVKAKLRLGRIYIITTADYLDEVIYNIQHITSNNRPRIIIEPSSKNTFYSITSASVLIANEIKNRSLLFLPCDQLILKENLFIKSIQNAINSLKETDLVVFGKKPTHPSADFGYIHINKTSKKLLHFYEKPKIDKAKKYAYSGAFWNMGMVFSNTEALNKTLEQHYSSFVNKIRSTTKILKNNNLMIDKLAYKGLRRKSFDTEVLSRHQDLNMNLKMVKLMSDWADLGSWKSLIKFLIDFNNSKALQNTYKKNHNYTERSNLDFRFVVNKKNKAYFLFSDKYIFHGLFIDEFVLNETHITDIFSKKHHMKKPWGSHKTIFDCGGYKIKILEINSQQSISLQYHNHRDENWLVVKGKGIIQKGNRFYDLSENETIQINAGTRHRVKNIKDVKLKILELQSGSVLSEKDIVRIQDDYGRT